MNDISPNEQLFEHPSTVLKRYGFTPKKSWGQNFLVSEKAIRTIASECTFEKGLSVLEIGAGLGTLTGALIKLGADVTAVERDPDMCHVLTQEFGNSESFILERTDAKQFDYNKFFKTNRGVVAGNLPYQITGEILENVLWTKSDFKKAVFMVQLEVALRICSDEGSKIRGALSVMIDARYFRKLILRLKPTAFLPPPKVKSAVVTLIPREQPLFENIGGEIFDKIVKACFVSRRKTIRNSLIKSGILSDCEIDKLLNDSSINPSSRAEQLTTIQFVSLAKSYAKNFC